MMTSLNPRVASGSLKTHSFLILTVQIMNWTHSSLPRPSPNCSSAQEMAEWAGQVALAAKDLDIQQQERCPRQSSPGSSPTRTTPLAS